MRRAAVCVAAGLAGAAFAAAAAAEIDRAALIGLAPSVVKIEAVDRDGRLNLGSGVVVADAVVATNCHVTRHAERVSVVKGGVRWNAPQQSSDVERDLCLLRVPALAGTPAVAIAASASLQVGQPLVAIGYTGGAGIQLSGGEVVALHDWNGERVIRSSNGFTSGASGGGLFRADGALVGLMTFRLRGGARHYFSMPADRLPARLADAAGFVALRPLGDARSFWERPAAAQPYFLQAASIEQAADWPRLHALAERWSRERPSDAEAAYTLAVAREGLGRDADALRALQHCVGLDPAYVRGWQRLAALHRRSGRVREMRDALDRLAAIDTRLAGELAGELERPR